MKINKTVLAAAAIVLPLSIGAGSALSYFTANDSAAGGYAIEVGIPETEIKESFSGWEKRIVITNTGDTPIYVRARAFVVSPYAVTLEAESKWTEGNGAQGTSKEAGYYYYDDNTALEAGAATDVLKLKILKNGKTPSDGLENEEFDVVVVYEKTSVVKVEDGKVVPDWDFALQIEDKDKLKEDSTEKGGN